MILEGQKDARTRVLLFIAVFFLSGSVSESVITHLALGCNTSNLYCDAIYMLHIFYWFIALAFTIREINNYYNHNHGQHHGIYRLYIMLVIEVLV